ncbi:RdgB/HAM1 family non-canonical purine NTP pyrophosphatase [Vicingaceae bacterium]|nr:RdgB/HAM1 family non-canonical purine NTP pyrophosphatase [Vicingaceae bacterium]MDB4062003.1 RdgB/HAM1 family non-canonical purine NTP pyrophosphatase [Vicingaceae bacterium]
MHIIFATQNPNKVLEIQNQIGESHAIESLLDLNFLEELEETQETLEGNALQKARFVYQKFGKACFADDTGLEIESLNGEPGVYSARYGGPEKSFEKNIDLVLSKLKGQGNRKAQFRTAIAYIDKIGKEHHFEGVCKGDILKNKIGEGGFGYDPIFRPEGYQETFAQLSIAVKNEISHRGLAVSSLIKFLKA